MNALSFLSKGLRSLFFTIVLLGVLKPITANAAVNLSYYTNPPMSVAPATAAWGQFVNLSFSVINTGSTASGQFQVKFYLSSSPTINPSTNYLWYTQTVPSLGNNQYFGGPLSINLPQTIPSGLSNGTVYVGMVIVLNGVVVESNLGAGKDLATMTTTTPVTLPDLVGYDGRALGNNYYFSVQQSSMTWGQIISVQHAVFNQTAVTAGAFTGAIYISETNHFVANSATCYQIGSFSVPSLPGGNVAISSGYENFSLPNTNPFGDSVTTFYVGMVINSNQTVTESNYTNNANQGTGIDSGATPVTITAAKPQIAIVGSTPPGNNLAFGSVNVDGAGGALATQTVMITNNGAAPLKITGLTTTGSAAFAITSVGSTITSLPVPNTYPSFIAADGVESWVVTVTYDPTAVGSQTGSLVITSNDPSTPSITLSLTGTGVAYPHLVFSDPVPPSNDLVTDYGSVVNDGAGGTSLSKTFTLTNNGSGAVTLQPNGIALTNTQGGVWSLVSITSSTQGVINQSIGYSIAPQSAETWSIVVKFDPTANTSYLTGLQVASNDPTQPLVNCTLQGTGVIPMTLSIVDSLGSSSAMNFGSTHATGTQKITGTLTLTNSGQLPLMIAQNGILLSDSTNFQITGILSNTQGSINLASGPDSIAPNGTETWTITVVFDPTAAGALTSSLTILSNDPSHGSTPITLTGTGLNQPAILVTNSSSMPNGTNIPFGAVLNDGTGGRIATQTVTIQNIGLQPLSIPALGVALSNTTGFAIQSIISSTQGAINLTSTGASIAANQHETWIVTLAFDPTTNTAYTSGLTIHSNDPVNGTVSENMTGSGTTPTITLQPQATGLPTLYVPAGQVYNVSWNAAYLAGPAQITLYTDTDTNPSSGLNQIGAVAYSPSNTAGTFAWRPSSTLAGQEFFVYGKIQDGTVSNGSYASQKIHVEAAGSFNLLSSLETTNSSYTYQYIYNGQVYTGTATLSPGQNVVTITTPLSGGGSATHQITVTKVASLLASQGYTYDELNRVKTYTNGNGITTTNTYDLAGNLVQTSASNGNVVSYTYDNLRRKTSMVDATGTTFYDYDDLDRASDVIYSTSGIKTDANNLEIQYGYDNANRLTDLTYPGGEHIQYSWDDDGRMTGANDLSKTQNTTYHYNYTTGLLQTINRANGIVTTLGYNNVGQVNDIKHSLGSAVLAEYSYTLNSAGNASALLTTFADGSQKQEKYTYDGLNRLVQVVYGSTATASVNDKTIGYTYDGVGNRLTQVTKVNNAVTQTLTYNYSSENRLASITDQNSNQIAAYFYDSAGNRIQKVTPSGDTYYSYDERNLLTSIVTPSDYITYTYNGLGQRAAQTVDNVTTQLLIDPQQSPFQTVQERSAGAITQSYVYGIDRLTCNPVTGAAQYYLPDRTGSVRQTADGSGNVLSASSYDVFGNPQ